MPYALVGDTVCSGGMLTLNPGIFSSYLWSTGEATQTVDKGASIYSVTVTDTEGCTAVDSATVIEVLTFLDIMPDSTAFCAGGSTTLNATLTGGAGICNIQWQYLDGATWTDLPGATGTSYSTPALTATTYYRARVTCTKNGCSNIASDTLVVHVVNDPDVTFSGGPIDICSGGTTTLTATSAGGAGEVTYEWQVSPDSLNYTTISGATNSTYTTDPITTLSFYRVIVRYAGLGCDSLISAGARVNVFPDPAVSVSGQDTVCYNTSTNLTANVSGGVGTCSMQWQVFQSGIFLNIAGANGVSYTTPNMTSDSTYRVRYSCTGGGCGVQYDTITVTTLPTVTIDSIVRYEESGTPFDGGVCFGDSILFDVVVSPTGTYSYSWNTGDLGDSLWVTPPYVDTNTVYYITVTNDFGCTAASFTAAKGIPEIISNTAFVPACSPNDPDTLSFSTSGGSPSPAGYQYFVSTLGLPEFHSGDWELPITESTGTIIIVSVKDEKGCMVDTSLVVPVHGSLAAAIDSTTCYDNSSSVNPADDYFIASITANNPYGGITGKYLLIYNNTILNPIGTDYGTTTLIGTGQEFASDGSSTYTITVQDFDDTGCTVTIDIGPVTNCSSCPELICIPVKIFRE